MLIYEIEEFDDCFFVDDDYNINLYLRDNNQEPYDITDYTVRMQLREQILSATPTVDISYVVDATDGPLGFVTITIPASTTGNLVPSGKQKRKYHYDIRITDTLSQTTTILRGRLTVNQSAPA